MTRKTPQELQEAKRQRAEERKQAAERARLEEEQRAAQQLERERKERERVARERELHARYEALDSYVGGIYDEVNKLSAKRPMDEVSDRMIERANRAIHSARELLADENDPFLDEIEEFIPAGDSIEARDVVLTLRQVKDALARMKSRHYSAWYPY